MGEVRSFAYGRPALLYLRNANGSNPILRQSRRPIESRGPVLPSGVRAAAPAGKLSHAGIGVTRMGLPIACTAIQRGKHVYCQKPMGHDVAEVRALTAAATYRAGWRLGSTE